MELDFNLVCLLIITFSCLVLSYYFLIVLPLRKENSNKKDEQLEVLDEIERRNFAHPLSSPAVPVSDPVDVVNAIKVKAAPDNKKDEKKNKEETLKMNSDTISAKQQQNERVNEKNNNIENNNKDSNNKTKVSKKKVQSTIVKRRDTTKKKNFYSDCNNNIKWKATNEHPGLEAFHVWHEEISNIYRIYKTNNNNNNNQDYNLYPSLSSSERGFVSLQLEVLNKCRKRNISVYWVDFKGKEHYKGDIAANGGFFHQTTWIGHPWIFRDSNNNNEQEKKIVLSFTPFRIIPTTRSIPTTTTNNERMGIHKFSILDSPQSNEESTDDNSISVSIHDPVYVHPSSQISTVDAALEFSILQMERSASPIASIDLILRYLKNIILYNHTKEEGNNNNKKKEVQKNVRRIRIANKVFRDNVWLCNDLCNRGIFFALGFVENGSFLEIGNNTNTEDDEKKVSPQQEVLPQDRKRDISTAIFLLEKLKKNLLMYAPLQQPQGVDGGVIGRAGWRI